MLSKEEGCGSPFEGQGSQFYLKDRELGRKPKPNKPMLELVEMMFASPFYREIKKDAMIESRAFQYQ